MEPGDDVPDAESAKRTEHLSGLLEQLARDERRRVRKATSNLTRRNGNMATTRANQGAASLSRHRGAHGVQAGAAAGCALSNTLWSVTTTRRGETAPGSSRPAHPRRSPAPA